MTELRTTTHCAPPLPVLRAVVFAVVGTVLGASAHHLAAEGPVPWRQGTIAAAGFFALGLAGGRRPRSPAAVVGTCAAVQVALHLWLIAEHAGSSSAMAMSAHTHHGVDAHAVWHERLHASVAMTVAHAVAAVLVAVLLHRADTACWSLARGLTAVVESVRARIATTWVLLGGRRDPADTEVPGVVLAGPELLPPAGAVLTDVVIRRGPPRVGLSHVICPCGGGSCAVPARPHAWRQPCSMPRPRTTPPDV